MNRLKTGNAAADEILGGGFPSPSINILMGEPGCGKTLFAEQLAFANLGARPVLYLSTMSEPLARIITYLQQYDFADPAAIGTRVIYEPLGEVLAERPQDLDKVIGDLIRTHRPSVIIIDSFKAISDLMPDRASWRRVIYQLSSLLAAYDTTSFWVGEYSSDVVSKLPEFAVADGIVELVRLRQGTRDDRFLRVVKLRGTSFIDGNHSFEIGSGGLRIYPRLTAPRLAPDYTPLSERLTSGISGLDTMIASGWLRGTTTLVAGPSGSGKSVLGLHFLREGVARGEPGLLVNFQESPIQVRRILSAFGWEPDELLGPGKLDILYTSPVEMRLDAIIAEMLARIERNKVRRLVIDAVGDLERSYADASRAHDYLYSLTQRFAAEGVTTMVTLEAAGGYEQIAAVGGGHVSPLSDNTLVLGMNMGRELVRTIRIVKSRGSAHDGRRHVLQISREGLAVGGMEEPR